MSWATDICALSAADQLSYLPHDILMISFGCEFAGIAQYKVLRAV